MTSSNPSFTRDLRKTDVDQLNLLAILHFVGAGLAVLGVLFLAAHYAIMYTVFSDPQIWKNQRQPMPIPPKEILAMMKWFYLAGALWCVTSGVLNLISGLYLRAQKGRTFSLVVAGINCLYLPLGTLLGVFTIIVLSRDSVQELYAANEAPPGEMG
jgi:hypothetical protein